MVTWDKAYHPQEREGRESVEAVGKRSNLTSPRLWTCSSLPWEGMEMTSRATNIPCRCDTASSWRSVGGPRPVIGSDSRNIHQSIFYFVLKIPGDCPGPGCGQAIPMGFVRRRRIAFAVGVLLRPTCCERFSTPRSALCRHFFLFPRWYFQPVHCV